MLGISLPTLKEWLSVLEDSYLVFRLRPYFANIKKRLVKTPKIYFYDTGILTAFLNIKQPTEIKNHPLYGQIFENFIIADLIKKAAHTGKVQNFYFVRDKTGNEIDMVKIKANKTIEAIEVKASSTFASNFLNKIFYFKKFLPIEKGSVIYKGEENFTIKDIKIINWQGI